ncbi:hypothetical protein RHSIM_Rhsim02G0060300 [Rhododendron simsii]|uniref:Nucleolar protein 6 n=1 Tax=Rhododendron simsii TaxID=118357 RepID=A0A834LTC2_RHOSS|nr:hypothetical protein RHSIM_Rhsim02G0060300 [Rhododendron simsii]
MASDTLNGPTNLKVRELLKEVQLDYSPSFTKLVDDTVSAIKDAIDRIPQDLQVTADVAPGFVRDIGADKVEFTFKKPISVEIGGSYSMRCIAKPDVNVDVFVRMPKEMFHEKDYLNHRYHAKRFLYLCIIKRYLKLSSVAEKVEWSTFQNESRKPILVVHPAMRIAEAPIVLVRIIPTATSVFNVAKLNMKRNNIRALNQGAVLQPTPKYNSSILEDLFLEDNAEFVRRTFLGWNELGEALILLKVWARQRSSIYTHDCLSGFLISVIMVYLASKSGGNRIKKSMNTMQIFRVMMDFIAASKLWETGLFFHPQGEWNTSKEFCPRGECICILVVHMSPHEVNMWSHHPEDVVEGDVAQQRHRRCTERRSSLQSFPVIICDEFAGFNLTFRMTKGGFLELRNEAALTLSGIDKCRDGGFDEVFMTKVDFPAKYDYCIRLNLKGSMEVNALGFCLDDECWRSYEQKVLSLMHQGLNDRAKVIRVIWRNTPLGCNLEDGLSMFDREPLLIGISVNTLENAFRFVDIGPNAENKNEALKFRKFWGDKAELRRFKDGTIAESTVWECKQWERHLIIKRISEHVLMRHLSLSQDSITTIVDQLDFSLRYGNEDPLSFSASLLEAFEVLSKHLRLLDDIPLTVSSVQPLDPGFLSQPKLPILYYGIDLQGYVYVIIFATVILDITAFRFTSVFPPKPHPLALEKGVKQRFQSPTSSCIQSLEVMIQLEGSGNWPMGDVAIEKTKSAFLLKIGQSLQSNWGMICNATEDDVVVFTSGYAFRLKILHEKGLTLTKWPMGSNQVKRVPSTDKILYMRSQHASMINGLQGRYPIYGPVVRLAKRWVAAHLLSTSLGEEAIELLVAYLFLKPLPFHAPSSRITGFLRFLRLLSEYDWAFSALVVDINGDLTLNDEKEVNGNFISSRKAYEENMQNTSPAMFLATAYDRVSEAWTRSSPTSSELRRLAAYAKSSANLLAKLNLEDQLDLYRWECLFRTPLSNYNAIVLLHRDRLPYPQHLLFPSEVNQGMHVVRGKPSKKFHPFLLPGDMKGSLEELKHKLMVNFDPLRCFVGDIEASIILKKSFSSFEYRTVCHCSEPWRGELILSSLHLQKEFPNKFKVWYDSLGGDAIGLTWEQSGSKKRGREEIAEEEDLFNVLKSVGEVGKGFVRSIYLPKAPKLK